MNPSSEDISTNTRRRWLKRFILASATAFSTTPGGVANQTVITPFFSGNATAYVAATGSRGFFVVGLVLNDVPL